MSKQVTLETGSEVQNIEGTSDCNALGYDSWKQFFIGGKKRTWPPYCRIHGCTNDATDGAHVKCKGKGGVWIIPMCTTDNNPSNKNWMTVNANTIAVYVGEKNASGPPGICF